ncbi:MAG: type II secretion system minor pseudopilin GspJ [Candidatus Thiodiazotropha sp.]|jgi:general secretion pathway protein J
MNLDSKLKASIHRLPHLGCRYIHTQGFTLLELLIAISIFAILATFVYSSLNVVLNTEQQTSLYSQRMAKLQLGLSIMQRDFRQVVNRPIRDQQGDEQPALSSDGFTGILVEFTRNGYANPMKLARSNLQRVAYQLEEGTLYRLTWQTLDRAQDSEPHKYELIDEISSLELFYYDDELKKHSEWPPEENAANPEKEPTLPVTIEMQMELKDWGQIRRIYPLARLIPSKKPDSQQGSRLPARNKE